MPVKTDTAVVVQSQVEVDEWVITQVIIQMPYDSVMTRMRIELTSLNAGTFVRKEWHDVTFESVVEQATYDALKTAIYDALKTDGVIPAGATEL